MNFPVSCTALSILFTLGVACAAAGAEEASDDGPRVLKVDEKTPKLEVRYSQIGFRDTLIFYTFDDEQAVLKLQFGNRDKTFLFDDDVTAEGLKKWLNNQHSDGLFPEVPEPTKTLKIPAKFCQVTSHELIDRSKQPFGEYENYDVKFEVDDYNDMMHVKLQGFTGATKVHVKTK